MKIEIFPDADAVARKDAEIIAAEARVAVKSRGRFIVAVSGGHTPWQMLGAHCYRLGSRQEFSLSTTICGGEGYFSVYSKHATAVELLLFDCVDDARPAPVIRIDPSTNRTYHSGTLSCRAMSPISGASDL